MGRSRPEHLNEPETGLQNQPASPKAAQRGAQRRPSRSQGRARASLDLFLIRHGIAAQRSSSIASEDTQRPLTAKGRKRVARIAESLHRLGYEVDWIVTSPLVRAAETAEIVAKSSRPSVPRDVCAALSPGGSPEDLWSFLASNPQHKRIMLVGHEPDLSELAALLIGAGAQANLGFKKGGCCLIRCDSPPSRARGQLVWWLTPRLLHAIRWRTAKESGPASNAQDSEAG